MSDVRPDDGDFRLRLWSRGRQHGPEDDGDRRRLLGRRYSRKMLNAERIEAFIEAFNDKGRLSGLMKTMAVKIVLNDQAALFGAARYAVDRANT